ncbi:hypothetical protein BDW74DRAFT_175219 [Aspergillus multicolor]|uniref:uncharacterized protein n=1 Tax=Aspergillus multicolor TaxID=41759 RepID=UPI003CCDD054
MPTLSQEEVGNLCRKIVQLKEQVAMAEKAVAGATGAEKSKAKNLRGMKGLLKDMENVYMRYFKGKVKAMKPSVLYSEPECMECNAEKPACVHCNTDMILPDGDSIDEDVSIDTLTLINLDTIFSDPSSSSASTPSLPALTPEDIAIANRKMLDKLPKDMKEMKIIIEKTSQDIARQEEIIKVTLEKQESEKDLLSRLSGGDMPWDALVSAESMERREAELSLQLESARV